jgi:hypothetical protein
MLGDWIMGILDFLFGGHNGSEKKAEVDEILAMAFDDPEFDELAEIGLIPGSNPGQDDEIDDDDNDPSTEPLRDKQEPFK